MLRGAPSCRPWPLARYAVSRLLDRAGVIGWALLGWPRHTIHERRWLSDLLVGSSTPVRIFEWGAGRSTRYYTRVLAAAGRPYEWHSAEHAEGWALRVQAMMRDDPHVHLHVVPFAEPITCVATHPDAQAISSYVALPETLGGGFDVIIIDGRCRRRCLAVAQWALAPQGVIVLHDAYRPYYQLELVGGTYLKGGYLPGTGESRLWFWRA